MFDKIIVLISLLISAISVISNVIIIRYQTKKTQDFETEKICLELFSDFLALCIKNSQQQLTSSESADFLRLNARLSLIADDKLINSTQELLNAIEKRQSSENLNLLINREKNMLQKRLKIFNRRHKS